MKLLVATPYRYYDSAKCIEPQFYYLFKVAEKMGYEVDFFDYITAHRIGAEQMHRQFLNILKAGKYDAAFIATYQDEFDLETLEAAKKLTNTFAWNSDDEWRWEKYSSHYVDAYSFMVTNSPLVYDREKKIHPTILHAQWACTGFWNGMKQKKDIDFSFVGQVYGTRLEQLEQLKQKTGIEVFGKGSGRVVASTGPVDGSLSAQAKAKIKQVLQRYLPSGTDDTISFEEVNGLWNRSRVSFTPLDSSQGGVHQIKSRIFDMGLSGTLMLSHTAPYLDTYYEPNKEYVPFETMEECIDKANFYIQHEAERQKIADAYAKRTLKDHMWESRLKNVLKQSRI